MWSEIVVKLRALVARHAADADIDAELRYHLERETERNVASGMSLPQARDAARRAFGNVTAITEQARDASRWRLLEELAQDSAYAIRTFRRAPLFVVTVVATIGLGLGLLTTAFTLFDAYALRPNAVRDPGSLYDVSWHARDGDWNRFSAAQARALMARRDVVDEAYAYANLQARLRGQPMIGQLVSGNYFQMLGAVPALGRVLSPDDSDVPGSGAVIVLSYDTWQAAFGGDSTVVGRSASINGVPLRIVGVARRGFGGVESVPLQFWVPVTMIAIVDSTRDAYAAAKPAEALRIVARVRTGVGDQQAAAALLPTLSRLTADRPASRQAGDVRLESRATALSLDPEAIAALVPVAIAFVLVMLIACANIANVMIARGIARQREIGIRLALGAARTRLVRQLLTECVVLAVPSAVAGFLVSRATIALGLYVMYASAPAAYRGYLRPIPLDSDARVAAFMMVVAIGAAVAFGLAPALQATRPGIVQATRGDFDSHLRPSRMRGGLVVAQVTVSALLLICAGILLRTAALTRRRDPGVRTTHLVQMQLADRTRSRAIDELRRLPGVIGLASATSAPMDGILHDLPAVVHEGSPAPRVKFNVVSPGYFGAVDLTLQRGRIFTDDESRARASVVVVSAATAQALWPGSNPIGEHLTLAPQGAGAGAFHRYRDATVIGVVPNASPGWIVLSPDIPLVYYPQPLDAPGATMLVHTRASSDEAKASIEHGLAAIDSSAVRESHTIEASLALQIYPFDIAYWVASLLGGIALLLTLTGVYGVVAYVVAQRTRELGVRMALGADPVMLIGMVMRQLARLAFAGLGLGAVLALIATRLLSSLSYAVAIDDPTGYAIGILVVLGACLVAALVPARRAGRVDPAVALRADA